MATSQPACAKNHPNYDSQCLNLSAKHSIMWLVTLNDGGGDVDLTEGEVVSIIRWYRSLNRSERIQYLFF